jgi:hypothetical protein
MTKLVKNPATRPTTLDHYYKAVRDITEKDLTMLDLLYGSNPITDDELQRLIEKRPHVYGKYAGYIGKRTS